jgi:hypothetical protein
VIHRPALNPAAVLRSAQPGKVSVGPFQDGSWQISLSELPSGPCTLEASAEAPYNEQASCFAEQAFVVPEENTAELDIVLECGTRPSQVEQKQRRNSEAEPGRLHTLGLN